MRRKEEREVVVLTFSCILSEKSLRPASDMIAVVVVGGVVVELWCVWLTEILFGCCW